MEKNDKHLTISISEEMETVLSKICFDLDTSKSNLVRTALTFILPILREHPLLLKFNEFKVVKQHFSDTNQKADTCV